MKKPPIIFVHGFRGSHAGLAEITTYLPEFKTYVPDIPPFGNSKPLDEYSVESYTNFLKNYIKNNGIKNPILIGHSMGSIIVAAMASKYPELINEKVVLLAPISQKPDKFFSKIQPLSVILPTKVVDRITTDFLYVPQKDRKIYKKTLKTTHECSKNYTSKKDVLKSAKFSTKHSIDDFKIDKKILFLSGSKDRLIKKQKTVAAARKYPNAKLVFLEKTGHLLNYEAPEKVASIIKDFLSE